MAEAIARADHGDDVDVVSAGSRAAGWVHPMAIRAMAEVGVDISDAQSKSAAPFLDQEFDAVVTVCDSAAQDCPAWPGAKRLEHWPIEDPTWGSGSGAERFRATREELAQRIEELIGSSGLVD